MVSKKQTAAAADLLNHLIAATANGYHALDLEDYCDRYSLDKDQLITDLTKSKFNAKRLIKLWRGCVYTNRVWEYECFVASKLAELCAASSYDSSILPTLNNYLPQVDYSPAQIAALTKLVKHDFNILIEDNDFKNFLMLDFLLALGLEKNLSGLKVVFACLDEQLKNSVQKLFKKKLQSLGLTLEHNRVDFISIDELLGFNLNPLVPAFDGSKPFDLDYLLIYDAHLVGLEYLYFILAALPKASKLLLWGRHALAPVNLPAFHFIAAAFACASKAERRACYFDLVAVKFNSTDFFSELKKLIEANDDKNQATTRKPQQILAAKSAKAAFAQHSTKSLYRFNGLEIKLAELI